MTQKVTKHHFCVKKCQKVVILLKTVYFHVLAEYVLDDPLTVTVPVQKVSKMTQKESKRVKNDPKRVKKVSFLVVQKVTQKGHF